MYVGAMKNDYVKQYWLNEHFNLKVLLQDMKK